MLSFSTDYTAGCHPAVLKKLSETNLLHTPGYGDDEFTAAARAKILEECGLPFGEVFFMVGGTQTNAVVIDRLLGRNDAVIAADTAHINVHEAGAIELSGHKILTLPGHDGKIRADELCACLESYFADETREHMVRPAMVYISFPTELGTLYSRRELEEIAAVCDAWDIPLYADGARLAYGLGATDNDLTTKDIARLCDIFYIGGTKCGALFGEAVVTRRPDLVRRFFSLMKMHGAVLAKGRLLALQFLALFDDGLYFRIGREAVGFAVQLREAFRAKGYKLMIESPTNQQFVILPNETIDRLAPHVAFELWGPRGKTETPVRFVTDWTTTQSDIDALTSML